MVKVPRETSGDKPEQILADGCPLTEDYLRRVAATRVKLLKLGYQPVRVHSPWSLKTNHPGKAPVGKDWMNPPRWMLTSIGGDPDWLRAASNTGILMGRGVCAVDVDVDDAALADRAWDIARRILPRGWSTRTRKDSPRWTALFRCEDGQERLGVNGERGGVEVLGAGFQTVVHGYRKAGVRLQWDFAPWDVPVAELPFLSDAVAREFLQACGRIVGSRIIVGGSGPPVELAQEIREWVRRHGSVNKGIRALIENETTEGRRYHLTFSIAGYLIARKWPPDTTVEWLDTVIGGAWGDRTERIEAAVRHAKKMQDEKLGREFGDD